MWQVCMYLAGVYVFLVGCINLAGDYLFGRIYVSWQVHTYLAGGEGFSRGGCSWQGPYIWKGVYIWQGLQSVNMGGKVSWQGYIYLAGV